jgi:hypothetical protein
MKFIALRGKLGRLTDFAHALYPLLVACADDFGRQAGEALTVKMAVYPCSRHSEADFTRALTAMHNVRLIDWFEHNGRQVIQILQFDEHQPGLSRRTQSKFPEPPVKFTEIPEIPVSRARAEQKRTELNRREENRREEDQNLPPPNARRDAHLVGKLDANSERLQTDRVPPVVCPTKNDPPERPDDHRRGVEGASTRNDGEMGLRLAATAPTQFGDVSRRKGVRTNERTTPTTTTSETTVPNDARSGESSGSPLAKASPRSRTVVGSFPAIDPREPAALKNAKLMIWKASQFTR